MRKTASKQAVVPTSSLLQQQSLWSLARNYSLAPLRCTKVTKHTSKSQQLAQHTLLPLRKSNTLLLYTRGCTQCMTHKQPYWCTTAHINKQSSIPRRFHLFPASRLQEMIHRCLQEATCSQTSHINDGAFRIGQSMKSQSTRLHIAKQATAQHTLM